MIDLQYFAIAINRAIGTKDFAVYLNTNRKAEESGKTVVTLSATRVPFGFKSDELDAESLSITLTFDLSTRITPRDKALEIIKQTLLGWHTFSIPQPDGTKYTAETFFEQQPPSNPYLDSGGITQQIVVSGNALVKEDSCAAIVGNNVLVAINGTTLLKVSRATSMQTGSDTNVQLSEDETLLDLAIISRTHTTELTCIYTGKEIEDTFLQIAEGIKTDENTEYTYTVTYPNFIVTVPVKIVSAVITDSVGAFLQYRITLQTCANAEITKPTEG